MPWGLGSPERVAALGLTCRNGPLRCLGSTRLWQRLAEGHRGIDELLHVAIDEHDVAASMQGQRGLGLVLELGEVPLAQRPRSRQRLQSLDLPYDLSIHLRNQHPHLPHAFS